MASNSSGGDVHATVQKVSSKSVYNFSSRASSRRRAVSVMRLKVSFRGRWKCRTGKWRTSKWRDGDPPCQDCYQITFQRRKASYPDADCRSVYIHCSLQHFPLGRRAAAAKPRWMNFLTRTEMKVIGRRISSRRGCPVPTLSGGNVVPW